MDVSHPTLESPHHSPACQPTVRILWAWRATGWGHCHQEQPSPVLTALSNLMSGRKYCSWLKTLNSFNILSTLSKCKFYNQKLNIFKKIKLKLLFTTTTKQGGKEGFCLYRILIFQFSIQFWLWSTRSWQISGVEVSHSRMWWFRSRHW